MKTWHFNVLFLVGVGGAVTLLVASLLGRDVSPASVAGIGSILAFILTQRNVLTKDGDDK